MEFMVLAMLIEGLNLPCHLHSEGYWAVQYRALFFPRNIYLDEFEQILNTLAGELAPSLV